VWRLGKITGDPKVFSGLGLLLKGKTSKATTGWYLKIENGRVNDGMLAYSPLKA
jgi:hypothetical protein